MPRFLPTPSTNVTRLKEAPGTKMVVRRTFLELEEDDSGDIRRTGPRWDGVEILTRIVGDLFAGWCCGFWMVVFGSSLGSYLGKMSNLTSIFSDRVEITT